MASASICSELQCPLSVLTPELLASILQLVPLKQRLNSCALVCKSFQLATLKTIADVDVSLPTTAHMQQLSHWLNHSMQDVRSIDVTYAGPQSSTSRQGSSDLSCGILQLPGYNLPHLEIINFEGCQLQLQEIDAINGSSTLLPKLRSLKLDSCSTHSNDFCMLAAASNLKQLSLKSTRISDAAHTALSTLGMTTQAGMKRRTADEAVAHALGCWSGLTSLSFSQQIGPLLRRAISTKTSLQELSISPVKRRGDASAPYSFMPTSLTALTVEDTTPQHSLPLLIMRDILDNIHLTPRTWPHACKLSQLRHLTIVDMRLDPAVLKCFTGLQSLTLERAEPLRPEDTAVNAAQFVAMEENDPIGTARKQRWQLGVIAAITGNAGLQHLDVSEQEEQPITPAVTKALVNMLTTLTDLRFLRVYKVCCAFEDPGPAPEGEMDASRIWRRLLAYKAAQVSALPDMQGTYLKAAADAGQAQILAAIGQLQHLQHLEPGYTDWSHALNVQQFTALTASSHLTALVLEGQGALFSRAAFQHMFSEGKLLPHLQRLELCQAPNWESSSSPPAYLHERDVHQLVVSCPSLRQLHLHSVVTNPALQHLTALPGLTVLSLAGMSPDDSAAAVIAQLTNLQSLSCIPPLEKPSGTLTVQGLQQWTALQGLTRLNFCCDELQRGRFQLRLKGTGHRGPPFGTVPPWFITTESHRRTQDVKPVWRELKRMCERYFTSVGQAST